MHPFAYLLAVVWIGCIYAAANAYFLAPIGKIMAALATANGGEVSPAFGLLAAMFGFALFAALSAGGL